MADAEAKAQAEKLAAARKRVWSFMVAKACEPGS